MTKTDFKKTSRQAEREILELVDRIDRALESSSGEAEKKGHFLFTAVSSFLVFAAIAVFQFFLTDAKKELEQVAESKTPSFAPQRLLEDIEINAARIAAQTAEIRETKARVAPSMQIDSNLAAIDYAVQDIRRSIKQDTDGTPSK